MIKICPNQILSQLQIAVFSSKMRCFFLKISTLFARISQFHCREPNSTSMYQSGWNCTRKEVKYFYSKHKALASIFNGQIWLNPCGNRQVSSAKHTSFLVEIHLSATEIKCILDIIKKKLTGKSSKNSVPGCWWKIVSHSNENVSIWLKGIYIYTCWLYKFDTITVLLKTDLCKPNCFKFYWFLISLPSLQNDFL